MQERRRGVVIDDEALRLVPPAKEEYTNTCIEILEEVQTLHQNRRQIGFYPSDLRMGELEEYSLDHPEANGPYTLIKRNGGGKLRVVTYKDIPELNRSLRVVDELRKKLVFNAVGTQSPEADLVKTYLNEHLQSFTGGDFSSSMTARINALQTPNPELLVGVFDTYDDTQFGIKYSAGGWLIQQDRIKTRDYSDLVTDTIRIMKFELGYRDREISDSRQVVVGNVIAQAGLPADAIWNGNTLPSEDDKRRVRGSVSYIFLNNLRENLNNGFRSRLVDNVPQLKDFNKWEEKLEQSIILNLVFHEGIGHPLVSMEDNSNIIMRNRYQPIKELEAEILGMEGIGHTRLNSSIKLSVALVSLAWAKDSIDTYLGEKDPNKRAIKRVYAEEGAVFLNLFEKNDAISIVNNKIHLNNIDSFFRAVKSIRSIIRNETADEPDNPGSLDIFTEKNLRSPRNYGVINHNPVPLVPTA